MYAASTISKFIVNWCNENDVFITNLKLQKLLYFIQGEYYKKQKKRLFDGEFYAWKLGPVIPSEYYKYAVYSSTAIPKQEEVRIEEKDSKLLDMFLRKYALFSTWDLVNKTHAQDPWRYNHEIFGEKSLIPFDSIKDYFAK